MTGGAGASKALFLVLVVMVVWLAASCGNSENGPPAVSVFDKPAVKTASAPDFSEKGVVDEDGVYSSIGYDPDDDCPAIAYIRSSQLWYAKWDGEDWDDQTRVDYPANYCVSLAFKSGCPSIAYYNATDDSLMWAYDEDDDGEWDDNEDLPWEIYPDVGECARIRAPEPENGG